MDDKLKEKLGILEGILFVVGDEGIDLKSLSEIMDEKEEDIKEYLKELKKRYEQPEYGLRISYLGNAFKLTTKKEHKDYYEKLAYNPTTNKLSNAALEILAIIAYKQPITNPEISDIRGVQSGQLVRKLVAKGLVKEAGKSDMPGRPNLYKTTSEFLDYFGLATIDDLPEIKEENTEEENSEVELFSSIYKDNVENE
ncbi:MAG: SMC-Scp complex subunit ScpB [Bacilli bacterium]|jgi:segregation and condensation protein B|nr:SMC-Scp complex subunit ScpB [Bacilli bacterium]